ncbi:MAG: hypothetical protein RL173_403 [Fibrobacterota bacterium]|jgi:hypothetical protein
MVMAPTFLVLLFLAQSIWATQPQIEPFLSSDGTNKFGFKSSQGGSILLPPKYDKVYGNGSFLVGIGNKWGLVDSSGKEVAPVQYDDIGSASNNLRIVKIGELFGAIDLSGKEVIPVSFERLDLFEWTASVASKGGKSGLVANSGVTVLPFKYDNLAHFQDSLFLTWDDKPGSVSLINPTGRILACCYDMINRTSFRNIHTARKGRQEINLDQHGKELDFLLTRRRSGYGTVVTRKGRFGVLLTDGTFADNISYDYIRSGNNNYSIASTGCQTDSLKEACTGGKWWLLDSEGKKLGKAYDFMGDINHDLVRVRKAAKWGYIDKDGKEAIPLKFQHAEDFTGNVAQVTFKGRSLTIDPRGMPFDPMVIGP